LKVNSSIKGDVLSQIPLKLDCCEELGFKFNVNSLPLNLEFKHVASHLDDLKHASFKISELEKEVQEQEWRNHQTYKQTAYSAVMYILLSIIIMYALYRIYKYVRFRCRPGRNLRALTAPLGVQTSTETSGTIFIPFRLPLLVKLFTKSGTSNVVNISIKTSNKSLALGEEGIPLRTSRHSLPEENTPRRSLRP
jgi:hypothetical protein